MKMRKKKRNRRTRGKVLMVVMINKNNVRERVVGMIATSLQPSLKQKGVGHLLRILIKDSHHIIDIISKSKEPTHLLLLLLMPMQDSTTVM